MARAHVRFKELGTGERFIIHGQVWEKLTNEEDVRINGMTVRANAVSINSKPQIHLFDGDTLVLPDEHQEESGSDPVISLFPSRRQ